MKEEIEEDFYRGLTREFKKRNDDCIAQQRLLYPNRERDWENTFFHSFPPSDSLYTSTNKRTERRKEKRKKSEREKLGKIIGSRLFVRPFVAYVEEETERETEIGENHCFQSFLFVVYVEGNTARERNWGKSLFHCFQSLPFIV